MAKKTSGPNKSEAIRNFYAENPKAKPMEVSEALKAQGIEVTPAFVSTIRSTSKKKKKVGRPGRPPGSTSKKTESAPSLRRPGRPPAAASADAGNVSIDALIKAKGLVESIGSISEARAALSALEKLMR